MKKSDFTKEVLRDSKEVVGIVSDLGKLAKPFHFDQNRAEKDRLLVRLHLVVNRIYIRAFPPLSSGELHGLPEEITEGAWEDRPIAMNPNKPEWEFNSWFREKTSDMRRFTDSAFDHFETNPRKAARWMDNTNRAATERPRLSRVESPEAIVESFLHTDLGMVQATAESIIELIERGELKIAEVRPKNIE